MGCAMVTVLTPECHRQNGFLSRQLRVLQLEDPAGGKLQCSGEEIGGNCGEKRQRLPQTELTVRAGTICVPRPADGSGGLHQALPRGHCALGAVGTQCLQQPLPQQQLSPKPEWGHPLTPSHLAVCTSSLGPGRILTRRSWRRRKAMVGVLGQNAITWEIQCEIQCEIPSTLPGEGFGHCCALCCRVQPQQRCCCWHRACNGSQDALLPLHRPAGAACSINTHTPMHTLTGWAVMHRGARGPLT